MTTIKAVEKVDVMVTTIAEMVEENASKCTSRKLKTPSTPMRVARVVERIKTKENRKRTGSKRTNRQSISVRQHNSIQKRHCKIKS